MVSATFLLLLGAVICFAIAVIRDIAVRPQGAAPWGVLLPLGLLLWSITELIAVWP